MAKKPPTLTVIDPAAAPNPMDPPGTLGEAGRKLWLAIHRDFVVDDAGGLEMLAQIAAAVDRAAEYAAAIERDGGPTIRTKTGIRDHPLIRHEIAARSFVVRSLHNLGLDVVAPRSEVGRPSGGGAYRGEAR
jgi:hypothetical protein